MRRRKAVSLSNEDLIKSRPLFADDPLPLLVEPAVDGVDLVAWVRNNREFIDRELVANGGILFRGFSMGSLDRFRDFNEAASDAELLEYSYRSTPRTHVSDKIYTSTEYPADQHIPMHNEMSYSRAWPMRIFFYSAKVAQEGGETPICDSRKVFARVDPEIRRRFEEKKVMYVRNYGGPLDLSWQEVFQTESRDEVERFCGDHHLDLEWKDDGGLRTRQVCQGVASHPSTGEPVWFNQAHLFHVSSLDPVLRESLLQAYGVSHLPRNAYYGDGTPIEASILEEIRQIYREESIAFPWRQGDILMLDNMLTAHGRRPFKGERKVLVGMTHTYTM